MSAPTTGGIAPPMQALYDVFVDWPGRLGRELPGLLAHLRAAGARRVLDLGCGTGRHVGALRAEGLEAEGADVSESMLERAAEHLGGEAGLHVWRLGAPPPGSLTEAEPFDAVLALGNVWPQLTVDAEARGVLSELRRLVRPGGLLLMGLKAVAVRRGGNPYLPLLKREHEGRPLWFVRFCDLDVPPGPDGTPLCEFHMVVVGGDAASGATDVHHHGVNTWRAWEPAGLAAWLREAGLERVRVGGRLDDPDVPPAGEDVFVHAFLPG